MSLERIHRRRIRLAPILVLVLPAALQALTITEIHYAPPAGEPGLQFIEVYNDTSTLVDVSGWQFSNGIQFVFPENTFIPGRSYLVVSADAALIRDRYGIENAIGDFAGTLDPLGETIAVVNNSGVVEAKVSYRDRGNWPAGPKLTGHTLSLRSPYLDPDDGVNWTHSLEKGGTPGRTNFPRSDQRVNDAEVVASDSVWKYQKGRAEFSSPIGAWRDRLYSDSSWLSGQTGIGYGDGDDFTVLSDMQDVYWSIACRKSFALSDAQIAAVDVVVLALDFDDGFIAYLNGTEVARVGIGSRGEDSPFNTPADDREAGVEEEFLVPKELLVSGTNVLAIQVHNTTLGSSDLSFLPRLVLRQVIEGDEEQDPVMINELFARTGGERWVELRNGSGADLELGSYHLSDDPAQLAKFTFPAGTAIPRGGFLVLTEPETGLFLGAPEVTLFLSAPDLSRLIDAHVFENTGHPERFSTSDARYPDGGPDWVFARVPTRGAPNQLQVEQDLVINEIMYHPFESRNSGSEPFETRRGEYLEIYNRGDRTIHLERFALTKGVDYTFAAGTDLPAKSYLVVAQDPAYLTSTYGILNVVGPWEGSLQNDGETIRLEDPVGNTVDEVRYADGGDWPALADGSGSSLELVDPRQDNSAGGAWEASDETTKAPWVQLTYGGSYQGLGESAFHFTPMETGSFLLDDVEIRRGTTNYVPNPGFEGGTSSWVMEGTLVHSRRITTEAHSGNACLQVEATDRGDLRVNRLVVVPSPALTPGGYTVRFWARWLSGGNLILAHGFDNDMAKALWMPVPRDLGTPGSENSATALLRARTSSTNQGPVMKDVRQEPARPDGNQPVKVTAGISDADGVSAARLFYRTGGRGNGVFTQVEMTSSNGTYSASIPGFDLQTKVLFYLEAADSTGESRRYPLAAPERTLLYQVGQREGGPLIHYRLILDDDRQTELETRAIQSDDPLFGSFVFDDAEIYYNVGLHYHGSPWERPGRPRSFKLNFPGDHTLHGAKKFNISRYGSSLNEATAYYTIGRTGRLGSPSPRGDYQFVQWDLSGDDQGVMGRVETVDGAYLSRWFPGDKDGPLFRANAKITFRLDGNWTLANWAALEDLGSDRERYRWNWDLHTRELEDDWSSFLKLMRVLDPSTTPTSASFDPAVKEILDVDMLARTLAVRVLNDDWDTIGLSNGQNAYLYYAPLEGRWKYLPWDMDGTFNNVSATLFPDGDQAVARLFERPEFYRLYLQAIREITASRWNEAALERFLGPIGEAGGQSVQNIVGFVGARLPSVLSLLEEGGTFRILTNGGVDFATASDTVAIEGEAPLGTRTILLNGEPISSLTWPAVTRWKVDVNLIPGENQFEFVGFDVEGSLTERASIKVTSTATWNPPSISSLQPSTGPGEGGTSVVILGSDFHLGVQVTFGAVGAASVVLVSSREVRAVTPPGTGAVDVKVTNLDGRSAVRAQGFLYVVPSFVRGDTNGDGMVKLNDAVAVLEHLFRGGDLDCRSAGDANDDGQLDISDPLRIIIHLFAGAGPLPAPYPAAGPDPTADALGCSKSP